MKTRGFFVANSSSTCWVLDIRDEGVSELLDRCKGVAGPDMLNRRTAVAWGKEVEHYAEDWIDLADWRSDGLGYWLLHWLKKIGMDSIVFMRESDEGMGGYLPCDPAPLARDSMEYH